MKRLKILLISILFTGCTSNIPKSNIIGSGAVDSNIAIIRTVKKSKPYNSKVIWTSIEKIYDKNKKVIYKRPGWPATSLSNINIFPGKYKINFRCNTSVQNENWMNIEPEAGGDYTVFCLTERRGESKFGKENIVALHPFFEKTSELESKKEEYQAIIDAPPTTGIEIPIENGKTRIIAFFEPASFLGVENRQRYTVTLNGKFIDRIDPLKYTVIDIANGQYTFKISNDILIREITNININIDGGLVYIACKENIIAYISCEASKEKPGMFNQLKPMHIFQYE
ncbi:MAG: hypothetical protein V4660_18485 [Pseudomonadota bacterium]